MGGRLAAPVRHAQVRDFLIVLALLGASLADNVASAAERTPTA